MASTGGCACGAVRYRLASTPYDAGWCHCRTCQRNSGSPAMVFATVPAVDFELESGEIGRFRSGKNGQRAFCRNCGTPLYMVEDGATTLDFSVATLDDPETIAPGFHIFYERHIPWAPASDDLPKFAETRP